MPEANHADTIGFDFRLTQNRSNKSLWAYTLLAITYSFNEIFLLIIDYLFFKAKINLF